MTTFLQNFKRVVRRGERKGASAEPQPTAERRRAAPTPAIEIAPNDPLMAYFLSVPGAVEIERLRLESPALEAMRAAGADLTFNYFDEAGVGFAEHTWEALQAQRAADALLTIAGTGARTKAAGSPSD